LKSEKYLIQNLRENNFIFYSGFYDKYNDLEGSEKSPMRGIQNQNFSKKIERIS
jgi:hypothetical protein